MKDNKGVMLQVREDEGLLNEKSLRTNCGDGIPNEGVAKNLTRDEVILHLKR